MKKGQLRQLVLSLGVGIAVFLVLALGLRWNFLFSAALGVGIYLGLWFLLTPRADPITLYFAQRPDGGEMQALMEEAERDLKAIRSAAGRITDVRTHEDALALTETGDRLYCYLREHPEKSDQMRRFMEYYLPTTVKLVESYAEFDSAGVEGENIRTAKEEIEKTMDTINEAFEKLLDDLYQNAAFEASADARVLKTVLAQDGYMKSDFEKQEE